MKNLLLLIALAASTAFPASAADQMEAGPRGGRLVGLEGRKAEFFVEPDRTVTVSFYDEASQPVVPEGQVVTASVEAPSGKSRLAFEPRGELLASTIPLPEGEGYTIVLQIRPSADAKPRNFRITYLAHECAECKRPEYACTCNH